VLFYTKPGGFMEDRKQSRTQAAADKAEKIFDLTEDMAIADQAKHKIFDLTDGTASPQAPRPVERPLTPPAPSADGETRQSSVETTHTPEPQESASRPLDLKGEPDLPPDSPFDEDVAVSDTQGDAESAEAPFSIEDEVSAAFDEVQSEPSPANASKDEQSDQLFDKLSGITQMVDDAVRQLNGEDASQVPPSTSPVSPSFDDDTLASDAAELETAISGDDEDDEVIELTDIVDPSEVTAEVMAGATAGQADTNGDDEIIDLVDIVDPAELEYDNLGNGVNAQIGNEDLMAEELSMTDEPDERQDHDGEEEIILLTDVLKKGEGAKVISLADKEAEEKMPAEAVSGDDMASGALDSESFPPAAEAQEASSDPQIETAVEHLLKTKYADTIQRMVSEAVEKAVAREVENIRRGLSDPDAS
jgi:hypothetical protein